MDLRKKGFQLPEHIQFDKESLTNTYGKMTAEAFERGFGATIGNALRRVLLSSIEGAAVTSIRMPGVLHEYSTITGVQEDVIDVVLNVKQLRFRMHSDEPRTLTVEAKGPGEIKGKDIKGDNAEVLTPDLHIATLGKNAKLQMEINIARGKGYIAAELNKSEEAPIDMIPIDAVFSPVRKVNYWVEAARVGRSTDYDKLVMEIWTDGSVTPQGAVEQAAQILIGHMQLFSFCTDSGEGEEAAIEADSDLNYPAYEDDYYEPEQAETTDQLLKSVEELELSVRSYNCLKNANILTLADLVQMTEQEMLRTKNFGRKSLNEIREIVHSMGLRFNMRVDQDELQKLAESKRIQQDAT